MEVGILVLFTSAYTSGPWLSSNPGFTLVRLNYVSERKRDMVQRKDPKSDDNGKCDQIRYKSVFFLFHVLKDHPETINFYL
jgi:hypothetical protein